MSSQFLSDVLMHEEWVENVICEWLVGFLILVNFS